MDKNLDMFAFLSESLLVLIISFLPFKDAARTSVLAKRWRDVWRKTKNVELNENLFVKLDQSDEVKDAQRRDFVDFTKQFIGNYRDPEIEAFGLTLSKPQDFLSDVQSCVDFAVSHNAKHLGLDFLDPSWGADVPEHHAASFNLPPNVYGHRALESIKLLSVNFLASEFSNFGVLKDISLGWIGLTMNSLNAILQNCPLLESVSLKKCWGIQYMDINLPNLGLKRLVIDKCEFTNDWFQVVAPNLKFLKYSGKVGHFNMELKPCMEEAELDFGSETEFGELGALLYKILQDLYSVRTLAVCSYMLQVLPCGDEPVRMQSPLNVRHLTLNTQVHNNELCGIKFFLASCPLLETLTLCIVPSQIFDNYEAPYEFDPQEVWTRRNRVLVYQCVTQNLKVVEVKGFRGTPNEISFLRYLLYFGTVMTHMNIYLSEDGDVELIRQNAESVRLSQQARQVRVKIME